MTQQTWTFHIDRPVTVVIPDIREHDARTAIFAYLAGKQTPGADWQITEGAPFIAASVLNLYPNEQVAS